MTELTELQKTKILASQNALLQGIAVVVILFSGLILSEIQIKLFGGLFGSCGFLIGSGLSIYALSKTKYTDLVIKQMARGTIKFLKIAALFVAVIAIFALAFYWAVKTQFVFITPNGLMQNLHYYYLSPKNLEHLMLVGTELITLVLLTNIIYRGIKKAPEYFKNINNQS